MIENDAVLRQFLEFGKEDLIPERELYKIPVEECGEKLVRIDLPGVLVFKSEKRRQFDGNEFLYARKGVVERLSEAKSYLPDTIGFKIFDAYRPLDFQQMLFNEEYQKVKTANVELDDKEITEIVFVSIYPPNRDPERAPPHSTGGALDITLVDGKGNELDMGSDYCDFGEKMYTNCTSIFGRGGMPHSTMRYSSISPKQRANRTLLVSAMLEAGFANYPGEWWHFMYGDREYAAYMTRASGRQINAMYGMVEL